MSAAYVMSPVRKGSLSLPPLIRGWKATPDERRWAIANLKMLHIYAGTSNTCNLYCVDCQTAGGKPLPREMTLAERLSVLEQAAALGCKYVHISGAGEPMADKNLWAQVRRIGELGMIPTVFTNGMTLSRENAKELWDLGASVMLKVHSRDPEIQDALVLKAGYSLKRDRALDHLIELGFNSTFPTRLGFDVVVRTVTMHEMESIWRYSRENNIFPLVKSAMLTEGAVKAESRSGNGLRVRDSKVSGVAPPNLFPILGQSSSRGRESVVDQGDGLEAFKASELAPTPSATRDLFWYLSDIDRRDYGFDWTPTPPWAAVTCDYLNYHMQVRIQGDVAPCIGHAPLGNIRDHPLEYFWYHEEMDIVRGTKQHVEGKCKDCGLDCYGCPCRRQMRTGHEKQLIVDECWADNV